MSVKQITVDYALEYPSLFNPWMSLFMYLMAQLVPTAPNKHLYFKPNCKSSLVRLALHPTKSRRVHQDTGSGMENGFLIIFVYSGSHTGERGGGGGGRE